MSVSASQIQDHNGPPLRPEDGRGAPGVRRRDAAPRDSRWRRPGAATPARASEGARARGVPVHRVDSCRRATRAVGLSGSRFAPPRGPRGFLTVDSGQWTVDIGHRHRWIIAPMAGRQGGAPRAGARLWELLRRFAGVSGSRGVLPGRSRDGARCGHDHMCARPAYRSPQTCERPWGLGRPSHDALWLATQVSRRPALGLRGSSASFFLGLGLDLDLGRRRYADSGRRYGFHLRVPTMALTYCLGPRCPLLPIRAYTASRSYSVLRNTAGRPPRPHRSHATARVVAPTIRKPHTHLTCGAVAIAG